MGRGSGSLLPRLALVASAALFATGGAAIKSCSLSGWQVACFRSAVAALFLILAFPKAARPRSWRPMALGAAYASTMLLFVLANKLTTAAHTIFLQSTYPLYVLLLAPWLLGEKVRMRDIALFAVVAAGMGMCLSGTVPRTGIASDPFRGNLFAVGSGLGWALTLLGIRWMARGQGAGRQETAMTAVVWGNVFACLLALPMALPAKGAGADWLLIAYLGVFQIGLAYVCLTYAFKKVPALEGALILLLEPVLNPVCAWLVHGESPGSWALAGGALILAGAAARAYVESRPALKVLR